METISALLNLGGIFALGIVVVSVGERIVDEIRKFRADIALIKAPRRKK